PPTVGEHDLLVKVHATTVNRTDCGYRSGKPFFIRFFSGLRQPKAPVLGNEFAGQVEQVGSAVTQFAVGDRVFGYVEGAFGAHAEYLSVPEDGSLATIPANLTYQQAAPGTEGSHYAMSFIRKAKIHAGQRVLVNGATGAIGSAAVQLLKTMDVEVTATCGADHLDLVKGLGADRVIDYTAEDFTQDDQTYAAVLDTVGKSTFGQCKRLLVPGGVYLSSELGPMGQNPALALTTPLMRGKKVVFPFPEENQEMVQHFSDLMASGQFTPVIDRTYPLDQVVDAYRYVETGRKIGNVVIDVVPAGEQG
ncbi:MAG: NAD(P)-dependent alcohol dehydrogenase, partial [Actinomycetota bacterium]|nr:NAD(P)-dependent alcohol dehydrogenase [Actinomycetota bacterium]